MPDRRWKQTERKVAALLGGQRVPVSGRGRGDAPDIDHTWLAVEVKDRASLPAWLLSEAVLERAGDPGCPGEVCTGATR